jgi:hypothetical protein
MTVDVVKTTEKIRCDACPVMCYIADGRVGACDRYANHAGELVRLDPLTILERSQGAQIKTVPFLNQDNRDNLGRDDESQDNKESDNWDEI